MCVRRERMHCLTLWLTQALEVTALRGQSEPRWSEGTGVRCHPHCRAIPSQRPGDHLSPRAPKRSSARVRVAPLPCLSWIFAIRKERWRISSGSPRNPPMGQEPQRLFLTHDTFIFLPKATLPLRLTRLWLISTCIWPVSCISTSLSLAQVIRINLGSQRRMVLRY